MPAPRATAVERTHAVMPFIVCAIAWAIPGGGHLWLGRWAKGLVFMVALPVMFGLGLALEGRLFPIEVSQPLVALAALADLGIGIMYFFAKAAGFGIGQVTAASYEYANAFLIIAGLLNSLVILDAYDIVLGRK